MRHRWTYIARTGKSTIFVDYKNRKTKISVGRKYFLHEGMYPFHNPIAYRIGGKA